MSKPEAPAPVITHYPYRRAFGCWIDAFRIMQKTPVQWFILGLTSGYVLVLLFTLVFLIVFVTLADNRLSIFSITLLYFWAFSFFFIISCSRVGFTYAIRAQERGEKPKLLHLVKGINSKVMLYSVLTAVFLVIALYGIIFLAALASVSIGNDMGPGYGEAIRAAYAIIFFLFLGVLVLVFSISWMVPLIAVFQRISFLKALKYSFNVWRNNTFVMLIYTVTQIIVLFVAILFSLTPLFFIGALLFGWAILSAVILYRDIFHGGETPALIDEETPVQFADVREQMHSKIEILLGNKSYTKYRSKTKDEMQY
ncbi:MAG: hypothetical protein LBE22_08265 [Azoarcus sp.]|jgi:hypothetical protein|nr:hypothetical protein [Azoarcus sp.]